MANQVFNLIKFKEVKIVGSYGESNIKYPSDIDLHENVPEMELIDILDHFIKMFKSIRHSSDTYLTDFKCGTSYNGKPLRWTLSDLEKGYQIVDNNRRINFIDTLSTQSVIKLDTIALINKKFTEITINYFFSAGSTSTRIVEEAKTSFWDSFQRYLKSQDYYKALKRLYKYYQIMDEKAKVKAIRNIFNSELGLENKIIIDLDVIQSVITKGQQTPPLSDIKQNILLIRDSADQHELYNSLDLLAKMQSIGQINEGINRLLKIWRPIVNQKFKMAMIANDYIE